MGQIGLLVMTGVKEIKEQAQISASDVLGEAWCRPLAAHVEVVAKGEQKPPWSICSPRASPVGLVASWSIKTLLGDCSKVARSIRCSEGLFSAKMVVQPLGEVLSPVWQKLKSAASGDHRQSPGYLDSALCSVVTGLVQTCASLRQGVYNQSLDFPSARCVSL